MKSFAAVRVFGRALCVTALVLALAGCLSPAQSLVLALIPDGTFATLLGNLQGVEDSNRKRLSELAARDDWAGVAQLAEQNIAADPTIADWWMVAGYAYAQLRDYARANRAYAEAVRLAPDDLDAWNMLAQSYRALGQPERALRTLDNALQVSHDSPMTHFLLGETWRDLKRPDRAVGHYEQAVQREPQYVEAWYALGETYRSLGRQADYERALAMLRSIDAGVAERLAAAGR